MTSSTDRRGRVRHSVGSPQSWLWLPTLSHGHLAKHPWCIHCGAVAFVGGERALDPGGIANLLGRLDRRFAQNGIRFTEAHRRLVMQRLSREGAGSAFDQSRDRQLSTLAYIVASYTRLRPETVESYLRSC